MNIVVRGRNVNVTERVQEYLEKKVGKLERYLPIIDEARMELSQEETRSAQHRMIAQLTVRSRGKVLRAEEREQDMFAAIDLVAEKMQRQITRFKDRLYSRGQVRGAETVRVPEATEIVAEMEVEAVAEAEDLRDIRFLPFPAMSIIRILDHLGIGHGLTGFVPCHDQRTGCAGRRSPAGGGRQREDRVDVERVRSDHHVGLQHHRDH